MADVVNLIPPSQTEPLERKIFDVILKSKNAPLLPEKVAKSILTLCYNDRLLTPEGLQVLLVTSTILEREKTVEALQELGLADAAKALSGG